MREPARDPERHLPDTRPLGTAGALQCSPEALSLFNPVAARMCDFTGYRHRSTNI